MRRTILGLTLGAALLAAMVGSAVSASQPRTAATMDAQCARFHMPRPFESPQASDYGQCAAWVEGALARQR